MSEQGRLIGGRSRKRRTAAYRAGRIAARGGLPLTACPYKGDEPQQQALRAMWVAGYRKAAGEPGPGVVRYDG